jgi:dienelactone hydrolase
MDRVGFPICLLIAAVVAGCSSTVPPPSPGATSQPTAAPESVTPSAIATAIPTSSAEVARFLALEPAAMDARYRAALPLFEYDTTAPLEIEVETSTEVDGIETKSVTYASSTGRNVPAALVAPKEHAGLPGIIWLCPCGPVVDRAQQFAPLGAIVITISAPQMRPDGFALTFTEQDRDELIELMIELRRAVDVLVETGADPNRIGFIGFSWGAAMGGVLAGIEPRIHLFALMFGDGGVVEHTLEGPEGPGAVPLSGAALDSWLKAMEPVESLYFIPHATATLLFQNGLHDESIAEVSARRFQEVASEPKDVRWYDSGHDPTPDAPEVWCDLAKWLKAELELSSADIAEC